MAIYERGRTSLISVATSNNPCLAFQPTLGPPGITTIQRRCSNQTIILFIL